MRRVIRNLSREKGVADTIRVVSRLVTGPGDYVQGLPDLERADVFAGMDYRSQQSDSA